MTCLLNNMMRQVRNGQPADLAGYLTNRRFIPCACEGIGLRHEL